MIFNKIIGAAGSGKPPELIWGIDEATDGAAFPSALQPGDIVFIVQKLSNTGSTTSLPAGYTRANTSLNLRMSYKVMGSTPDTSLPTIQDTNQSELAFAFRNVRVDDIGDNVYENSGNTTGWAAPSQIASGVTSPSKTFIILIAGKYTLRTAHTLTDPSGYTLIATGTNYYTSGFKTTSRHYDTVKAWYSEVPTNDISGTQSPSAIAGTWYSTSIQV